MFVLMGRRTDNCACTQDIPLVVCHLSRPGLGTFSVNTAQCPGSGPGPLSLAWSKSEWLMHWHEYNRQNMSPSPDFSIYTWAPSWMNFFVGFMFPYNISISRGIRWEEVRAQSLLELHIIMVMALNVTSYLNFMTWHNPKAEWKRYHTKDHTNEFEI